MFLEFGVVKELVTPLLTSACRRQICPPPPVETVRLASFANRLDQPRVLHNEFKQKGGACLLRSENQKGGCRSFPRILHSVNRTARLPQDFGRFQANFWFLQKVPIHVVENQVHAVVLIAVADRVSALIVDFKDVSGPTVNPCSSARKDNLGAIIYEHGYVHAVRVFDPFARVVVLRNSGACG